MNELKPTPKHILLIDSSPLFEGFLKEKLQAEQIKVTMAHGDRDAFQKMVSQLPDLIIIDIETDFDSIQNFLESKLHEPNTVRVPAIMAGPQIPKEQIANLKKFGVIKYFAKPIKFDALLQSIGKILRMTVTIDETDCALETHINGSLIFIEIANGLNYDKISLLKYHLAEILDKNTIHDPRIILMMSNLDLTFVDGANLELLFDIFIDEKRIKRSNIKVLAENDFIKELLAGHPMYSGIEIVSDINSIYNNFVEAGSPGDFNDNIYEKILLSDKTSIKSDIDLRFISDSPTEEKDEIDASSLSIAIVDSMPDVQNSISQAFNALKAKTFVYPNGQSFVQALTTQKFNIVILDLYLPDVNGFQLLQYLKQQNFPAPILVFSMAPSKEFVLQALQLGAKSFIGKPQKPETIVQKSLDIIKESLA